MRIKLFQTKNLNFFKSAKKAIEYETIRQSEILNGGGKIIQEIRKWNGDKGKSLPMCSKEQTQDYKYFPHPYLLPIIISEQII